MDIIEILKVTATSLVSIAALFVIDKLIGHKQIVQMDFFDYIVGITIGSVAAELATDLEDPVQPLTAMIVYGVVSIILNFLTSKFPKTRKYINGSPTIIMDGGKLYRANMEKAKLDLTQFMVMCRQLGYFNLSDIQTAVFEYNGKLSILPVSDKRPATPADMNLNPPEERIFAEVIMDGRILDENLQRMGLNIDWLQKQLKAQGYRSAAEIFLGVCDNNRNLALFREK